METLVTVLIIEIQQDERAAPSVEKAEEPEVKLPTSARSWKKQESSRKASISALLTMPKPLHFPVWNQSVVPCPVLTVAS